MPTYQNPPIGSTGKLHSACQSPHLTGLKRLNVYLNLHYEKKSTAFAKYFHSIVIGRSPYLRRNFPASSSNLPPSSTTKC